MTGGQVREHAAEQRRTVIRADGHLHRQTIIHTEKEQKISRKSQRTGLDFIEVTPLHRDAQLCVLPETFSPAPLAPFRESIR